MRARKICSVGGCPKLQPCPDHAKQPWSGSARDRGQRISGGRRQARARYVIDRDDTICHICGYPGADEADHIIPLAHGGADSIDNMAAIHREPCHREKTAREARSAPERAPDAAASEHPAHSDVLRAAAGVAGPDCASGG